MLRDAVLVETVLADHQLLIPVTRPRWQPRSYPPMDHRGSCRPLSRCRSGLPECRAGHLVTLVASGALGAFGRSDTNLTEGSTVGGLACHDGQLSTGMPSER